MVTVTNFAERTCIWCTAEKKEGVEAEFKDGLKGFLCKSCFWRAVRVRAEKYNGKSQLLSTASVEAVRAR
jgi:hypothetical protein